MKQDKYGIFVPDHTKIPLGNDRAENTTRIYTTKDGNPMLKAEVDQCIKMYEKEMGTKPCSIVIPDTLKEHALSMELEFKIQVKFGAPRPNQITLSSV